MYLWVSFRLLAAGSPSVWDHRKWSLTLSCKRVSLTRWHVRTQLLFHRTRQCFSPPGPLFLKVYLHGYQQTQIVLLSGAVHPDKKPEAWALLRNIWACMHICLKTIVHQPAWTERQLWQWQSCINDKSQLVTGTDLPKKKLPRVSH